MDNQRCSPKEFDAIKTVYRQSKDGFVVSFAILPHDMPAQLANADIGSQWRIVAVPLDENGNPTCILTEWRWLDSSSQSSF